jgi:hypothetical protein
MADRDKEYLRDLFAGFKSVTGASAEECFKFADTMMEARDKEESYAEKGITAIKKRAPTRKADE